MADVSEEVCDSNAADAGVKTSREEMEGYSSQGVATHTRQFKAIDSFSLELRVRLIAYT
jgi:hypothetical protein